MYLRPLPERGVLGESVEPAAGSGLGQEPLHVRREAQSRQAPPPRQPRPRHRHRERAPTHRRVRGQLSAARRRRYSDVQIRAVKGPSRSLTVPGEAPY